MTSKYAMALYEMVQLRANLDRCIETFPIDRFRDLLAVKADTYKIGTDFQRFVIDPAVLEGYTGRYQVTPAMILTITREGGRLFTQATGQPKFEVFAESAKQFFVKAFDAQLTFRTDAQGKATEVVLHQGGADLQCKKIGGLDQP